MAVEYVHLIEYRDRYKKRNFKLKKDKLATTEMVAEQNLNGFRRRNKDLEARTVTFIRLG